MSAKKNTKKQATFTFMLYPSGKDKFTAVCFELGLVREGADPLKLRGRISALARKYIESVIKNNLDNALLNQELPAKYVKKLEELKKAAEHYENMKKWQKAFETLIWQGMQKEGKLLTTR